MNVIVLMALLGLSTAQFEWVNDTHVQRMMKAQGFFDGDEQGEWGDASKGAFEKWAATDKITINPRTYRPQESEYARQRVGAWLLEHDVSLVRPRTVGVFFLSFNKERCGGGEKDPATAPAGCVVSADRVRSALDTFFRAPNANAQYFFSLATRGLHRFVFSEQAVHFISVSSTEVNSLGLPFLVRDEVRWSPLERYGRSVFVMPPEYTGMGPGVAGMAGDGQVTLKVSALSNIMHELGHTLGLNHCGAVVRGVYGEYDARTSIMSGFGTQGLTAPELDWLRVINHNVLALTASKQGVQLNSLTSLSAGYTPDTGYSPVSGWLAAVYKSPNNGPEYYIEWRENVRQDRELDPRFVGSLLVHHRRQFRHTELDAVIALKASWTSPRGDLTIRHTGPVGTFDVVVGPVTNPAAEVSSWTYQDFLASFRK